jgi:hypothetical protein
MRERPELHWHQQANEERSAAADQMRTSWEKLVQHVGTAYGEDISNELTNRTTVTIAEPVYPPAAIARHAIREELVREGQVNMQIARLEEQTILEQEVAAGDRPAKMKLAALNNGLQWQTTRRLRMSPSS